MRDNDTTPLPQSDEYYLAMAALDHYEPFMADGLPKSTSVTFRIHQLGHAAERLRHTLVQVRAHTSYVNPTPELLQGLLQSIERILDAALDPPTVISNSDTRLLIDSGGVGHLFDGEP